MAKTHAPVTTLVPTVAPTPAKKEKKAGPTKVAVSNQEPTAVTKKEKKADRPACAEKRKEAQGTDNIAKAKEYDGRQGTLRHEIVKAIQGSETVWDALKQAVNDPHPGKKHSELVYTIKKVDIGFALGNGYITLTPVK